MIIGLNVYGQTDGMSYQAVILNPNLEIPGVNDTQNIYPNKPLKVKFTITKEDDSIEYQEIQSTTTDAYGMINLIIGNGTPTVGVYKEILWYGTPKDLRVDIDIDGSFKELSTQAILFTPVAFHRDIIGTGFLTIDGVTNLNDSLTVNNAAPTLLTGTLEVLGETTFQGNLTVNGITNLNNTLNVNLGAETNLSGPLNVDGATTLNNSLTVTNASPTSLSGNLVVDGTTNLNNSLSVNNSTPTILTGTLNVNGATTLNNNFTVTSGSPSNLTGILNVDGATTINNNLTVTGASPTYLTGDLTVDGNTNLNSSLTVNNGAPTILSGTMTVAGATNLESNLNVAGATNLASTLNVDGVTTINNNFSVTNGSTTNLSGNLVVDGTTSLNSSLTINNGAPTILSGSLNVTGPTNINNDLIVSNNVTINGGLTVPNSNPTVLNGSTTINNNLTVNSALAANGQVTITAALPLDGENYNNYPLRVQGSGQGIAVRLEDSSPNNANNFITFFDSNNNAVGRIEGESETSEVLLDPDYILENVNLTVTLGTATANVATSFVPITVGGLGVSAGPCTPCIIGNALNLALAIANLAAFNAAAFINLGVTYQSGSADYAEWLERSNPNEILVPGDIVGVTAGKISKNTVGAHKLLAISTKPAVLGNMPAVGQEFLNNKVAFMGQIPVKVKGRVLPGDYILPSGNNDGIGIGVSPNEITAKQYKDIVGVAWSSSYIDNPSYTMINMAIGLNSNDVAALTEQNERRILELEKKNKTFEERLLALEKGEKYVQKSETIEEIDNINSKPSSKLSKDEIILSSMPSELSDEIYEEALVYLETTFKSQNFDFNKHIGLKNLLYDPVTRNETKEKVKKAYRENYLSLKRIVEKSRN